MALRYEGWRGRGRAHRLQGRLDRQEFRPDAVVLDVMLPDFDGLEVLRRMRTSDRTCRSSSSPRATPSRTGSPGSPPAATTTSQAVLARGLVARLRG